MSTKKVVRKTGVQGREISFEFCIFRRKAKTSKSWLILDVNERNPLGEIKFIKDEGGVVYLLRFNYVYMLERHILNILAFGEFTKSMMVV